MSIATSSSIQSLLESKVNAMAIIDIVIAIFSFIYIILAVRNNPYCFLFGCVGSGIWAYHSFVNLNLAFDAFLQLFYVLMGFWGLYNWIMGGSDDTGLQITRLKLATHGILLFLGIIFSVGLAWLATFILDLTLPYLDALTTSFSIIATFLLIFRKIDNWLYFITVNLLYLYIYAYTHSYLLMGIMAVYTILAVVGYKKWRILEYNERKVIHE